MCKVFIYIAYIALCSGYIFGLNAQEDDSLNFKNCTVLMECPDNAICTRVNAHLQCVCWQGYHQNPEWRPGGFDTTEADYCAKGAANKTVVYNRPPARKADLAVAIVLVLFGVIVVTVIVYCLVVMRPIKRTQAVYHRIQVRRKNHRRLEEFDDIDMTFRNGIADLS
ncbi:uncharacterized protein LOC132784485 [Drosophila nasuta]|uniref:uncharacterized protein LOC132784485 n=1 Tax=Drosophila nasuta TaxID=42062 RepID=UPI00295F3753|nr:uncharacterized protein LOC132784485 [Drosophila nasuta]